MPPHLHDKISPLSRYKSDVNNIKDKSVPVSWAKACTMVFERFPFQV